jgi:hypothetical protein
MDRENISGPIACIAVARERSFTRAAARLAAARGVQPPAGGSVTVEPLRHAEKWPPRTVGREGAKLHGRRYCGTSSQAGPGLKTRIVGATVSVEGP